MSIKLTNTKPDDRAGQGHHMSVVGGTSGFRRDHLQCRHRVILGPLVSSQEKWWNFMFVGTLQPQACVCSRR